MKATCWIYKKPKALLSMLTGEGVTHKRWPEPIDSAGIGYGVLAGGAEGMNDTLKAGFDYFYADGPYFLLNKNRKLRFARNSLWHTSGPDRQADIPVAIKPWKQGDKIIVAPNHDQFKRQSDVLEGRKAEGITDWIARITKTLRAYTDREIVVRKKPGGQPADKNYLMHHAFKSAWAVVTCGSNIGVEAICAGVPVFSTAKCAASPMARNDLTKIETPLFPDNREQWAMNLAAREYDEEQIRSGEAWSKAKEDMQCA